VKFRGEVMRSEEAREAKGDFEVSLCFPGVFIDGDLGEEASFTLLGT
jgi:hypothetical protein